MKLHKSDRIAGFLLLVVACLYWYEAMEFESGFIADPIGPKAFPYLLGTVLSILSLWLIVTPGENPGWPSGRFWGQWGIVVAGLLLYAVALTRLGFIFSTCFLSTLVAVLFGARFGKAVALALVSSIAAYFLFNQLLGLPLPVGTVLVRFLSGGG